jgi:hypothetical protein
VTLDFGAEVEDTDPSVVLLKFQNTSSVPLSFFFRHPNESETDIEYWVETAEKSQEEAKQEFLIDRRLFNISPKVCFCFPFMLNHPSNKRMPTCVCVQDA